MDYAVYHHVRSAIDIIVFRQALSETPSGQNAIARHGQQSNSLPNLDITTSTNSVIA